ncbi:acyltransferase family protein [Sphingomonas sp. Leaf339]|uniref:acyltransferase family protein n=1 Tax=Sphingomonas sp. Leaf339 TaxID=1736343 RepID=UPI000A43BB2D|nr:acyltransferase [Sphingomonas sp. Leaf339]
MVGGKLYGANFIRAAACLAVFAHHISTAVMPSFRPSTIHTVLELAELGKFGVSLFFVLSGFLLGIPFWRALDAGTTVSIRTYTLRRMARIAPAAWVCLLVSFFIDAMFIEIAPPHRLIRLVTGLLFISDWHWVTLFPVWFNGPLWSISFEVSSYLMMPICFVALHRLFPTYFTGWIARCVWALAIFAALLAHGIMISVIGVPIVTPSDGTGSFNVAKLWFPVYNPFGFFAMFGIGTLSAGIHIITVKTKSSISTWIGVCVLAFGTLMPYAIYTMTFGAGGLPKPPFAFPMLPLAAAVFLFLCQRFYVARRLDGPLIAFIARISFGIYIWHALVIQLAMKLLGVMNIGPLLAFISLMLLSITITGIIATISYRYFEEPVIKWARRFERGGQSHLDINFAGALAVSTK